jgi:MoaA/NifB/PqqE/SkfB family radical SAM enzyme/ubiquinone/menaquinone biosynthesis C-methylase UbiE
MKENEQFLSEFMAQVDLRLYTPSLYQYLLDFLEIEKVRRYNGQYVINTFIPPYPGPAFDRFLRTYFEEGRRTPIQAVDLAVTNACMFHCWHCYNAGRVLCDLSTDVMQQIVVQLQDVGAIVINFTGGEPCLRHDIVDICSAVREDSVGILATTGYGFTDGIAERLRDTRIYSISISLDSADEEEHDRQRGVPGAFRIALQGIETAKKWGFYTYTCAVPSKKLLRKENFRRLVELNEKLGVNELQLIEPAPAGKIVEADLSFGEEEFGKVIQYMSEYNQREGGVAISSFAHMESPECFGCGAGQSHIYIDGSGEVSPCNMIPVSYGNAGSEDLSEIITRMQKDYRHPYCGCVAHEQREFFAEHARKLKPVPVDAIPPVPLPAGDELPRFFDIMEKMDSEVAGNEEIMLGYDDASSTYEDYWLTVADAPIEELFDVWDIPTGSRAVDCACGTGYTAAKLGKLVGENGSVLGIDLTPGMIEKAKERMRQEGLNNVEFRVGDVLEELEKLPPDSLDVAALTWLIGYVGGWEIFPRLRTVLKTGGKAGFVAHLDRSPRVPIEVFEEIVREEPLSMMKTVKFKFPQDAGDTEGDLRVAGFDVEWIRQSTFDFVCQTGMEVYDHVMKSGAGTTFYYSLQPEYRERFAKEFVRRIEERFRKEPQITIVHDYVVGIGVKPE